VKTLLESLSAAGLPASSDYPIAIAVQPIPGRIERAGEPMAAETLLQVIELFPGPALVLRPDGEIVGVNDRAERWLGLGQDELRGRPLARLIADPPDRVAGFLEDCARGDRKVVGAFTTARGDGAGGPYRVEGISVRARHGTDGPPLVVVHVLPGESGAGVVAARECAPQAIPEEARRKEEPLARLAHDLRNPVAAISGALDLARRATSREDVTWAQDTMERQIGLLVRRIDDLLDLARDARENTEQKRPRPDAAEVTRVADAPPGSTAESEADSSPSAAVGARILIVDDNVDSARGTARLLQLAGHDVRVAYDGHQALEIARDYRPQFVILDIVLPGMDGYEVARQLRGDPRLRDAVIIAASGYSEDDYRRPEEAGFDHHLVKPIDHNALRAILDRPAGATG
jgi:PAS domain S-box-containing protein